MNMTAVVIVATIAFIAIDCTLAMDLPDPTTARYDGCDQPKGGYSTKVQNGFVPGLYSVTSNLPGATWNNDGSLATRKIVCAHEDYRTSGGSVVIPWAQFDKRDGEGRGYFDWDFVDGQMEPWITRGQMVNLLVWPAAQKKDQLFPEGASATPDYIMNMPNMTYQCPDGYAQYGSISESIPIPKFWKPEVFQRYTQALKQFVERYEDHPSVNYFRFGIGVGAESYPCNGGTTSDNYCMETLVSLFEGDTYEEKAKNAYKTWMRYAIERVRAFRRFNSTKPIVVTLNDFATLPSVKKMTFPNAVADEATRDYFENGTAYPILGLGVQGATTNDIGNHDMGIECYANWCELFNRAKDLGVPLQIQTPLHSGVNGRPGPWQSLQECQQEKANSGRYGCTNTGNVADLIEFSLSIGANAFELYSYEWLVANDKNWLNSPPELNWHKIYGQQYSNALTKASNAYLVPEKPLNEKENTNEETGDTNEGTGDTNEGTGDTNEETGEPTSSSASCKLLVATVLVTSLFTVLSL